MDELTDNMSINDFKEIAVTLGLGDLSGGVSRIPEYRVLANMMHRCYNPNGKGYKHYGERGIEVCAEWHYFPNFLIDMGRRPSPEHQIHRIDPDGNYEPSNCRWVRRKTNMRHTRSTKLDMSKARKIRLLAAQGMSHSAIAKKFNINRSNIWAIVHNKTWKEE